MPRRVLIASNHPLFAQGLRSLLKERSGEDVAIVGVVSSLPDALEAIKKLKPDLVIVDYDDKALNRDEFLARFVEGEGQLRVVLLSLNSPSEALVYDRRTLAAAQIDDWLNEWAAPRSRGGASRNANPRRNTMRHLITAGILVIIVTALLIVGMGQVNLLPVSASAQAVPIDSLFALEFNVIYFLFALIVVLMGYSIVVFRRKKGDTTDAAHIEGNTRLEVLWTVAPLITVLYFAYLGGQSLAETTRRDPRAMEINVIGSQWSWRFEYPELGVSSDTLYLPLNKQVVLRLRSLDVIHSFWVPEFRVKQDALPGGEEFVRELRITPTLLGDYKVRCAELCGVRHAYMESPVKVLGQADYDAWVASVTNVSADPVERGQGWAKQFGCLACHSLDGSPLVGPSWQGLYGEEVSLADGSTVVADDAYIIESIRNTNAKIVQGFAPNIMPANIGQQLSDRQIEDIIAFMKTLR